MRNDVNTCVQDVALLQGSPQSAVEPVLEIEVAPPLHDMSEQVSEEGRVFVQERCEVESALGRDQLVEPDLVRWQLSPVTHLEAVIRIGPQVTDSFEDHLPSVERVVVTRPRESSGDGSAGRGSPARARGVNRHWRPAVLPTSGSTAAGRSALAWRPKSPGPAQLPTGVVPKIRVWRSMS